MIPAPMPPPLSGDDGDAATVARATGVPIARAAVLCALLDEGHTVPFIVRYVWLYSGMLQCGGC